MKYIKATERTPEEGVYHGRLGGNSNYKVILEYRMNEWRATYIRNRPMLPDVVPAKDVEWLDERPEPPQVPGKVMEAIRLCVKNGLILKIGEEVGMPFPYQHVWVGRRDGLRHIALISLNEGEDKFYESVRNLVLMLK